MKIKITLVVMILFYNFGLSMKFTDLLRDELPDTIFNFNRLLIKEVENNLNTYFKVNPELPYYYIKYINLVYCEKKFILSNQIITNLIANFNIQLYNRYKWSMDQLNYLEYTQRNKLKYMFSSLYYSDYWYDINKYYETVDWDSLITVDYNKLYYISYKMFTKDPTIVYDPKQKYYELYVDGLSIKINDIFEKYSNFPNMTISQRWRFIMDIQEYIYLFQDEFLTTYNLENPLNYADIIINNVNIDTDLIIGVKLKELLKSKSIISEEFLRKNYLLISYNNNPTKIEDLYLTIKRKFKYVYTPLYNNEYNINFKTIVPIVKTKGISGGINLKGFKTKFYTFSQFRFMLSYGNAEFRANYDPSYNMENGEIELIYDYKNVRSPDGWHSEIERRFSIIDIKYSDIDIFQFRFVTPIFYLLGNFSFDFGFEAYKYDFFYSYKLLKEINVIDSTHPTDQNEYEIEEIKHNISRYVYNSIFQLNYQRKNFMISYIYDANTLNRKNIVFSFLIK